MVGLRPIGLVVVIALAVGCAGPAPEEPAGPSPAPAVVGLDSPAGEGSLAPNLTVSADGRAFLTWLEPEGTDDHALRFASRRPGESWSPARTIARGRDWFVNGADVPSMVVRPDGVLVAHWLANHRAGTEAADVTIAMSQDDGETWSPPIVPHRDRSARQHGFAALVPAPSGDVHVLWLDGRHTEREGVGDMALMHTTVAVDGALGTERALDARVCDCCPLSAAMTTDALVVVYRDRSDDEVRDVSVLRWSGERWSDPVRVAEDGWTIAGCPVNGPAVSADQNLVAVAWFTAADDRPRVSVTVSADGGRTFGPGVTVSSERPIGRVDTAVLPDGGAVVAWIEGTPTGPELRLSRVGSNRMVPASWTVASARAVDGRSMPRIEHHAGEVTLAWTTTGVPSRVMTATLTLSRP